MNNKKVDVLSFTYSSKGRDVDILEPVLSQLEIDLNLTIERRWLYSNFVFDILKYRPKMLILANAIGCYYHYWACKFASMIGIKVVTFVSEGDYRYINGSLKTMLFGWNKEEHLYEDLHLEWSVRNIELFKKSTGYNPEVVKLSGATGFDKYSFLSFMSKDAFLNKYDRTQFIKIIGLGGWTFDFAFNVNHSTGPIYFGKELEGIKSSLQPLREAYKRLVLEHPEVLFICKKHPLTLNAFYDEFSLIKDYPNVIILQTEETIYDLINVSDFWITFDSTTALEAWLLNKITILYNPVIQNFNRSTIAAGSPIITSQEDLLEIVDEFYENNGSIDSFNKKESDRKNIIKEVIAFSDGKNYIRASKLIEEIYNRKKVKKEKLELLFIIKMLFNGLRDMLRNLIVNSHCFVYIPRVKRFLKKRSELYDQRERLSYKKIYMKSINNV